MEATTTSPPLTPQPPASLPKDEEPTLPSQWPWQCRPSIYDPPTLLDSLLESPLSYFLSLFYRSFLHLRRPSFRPPPNKPRIRVVCLSDTHNNLPSEIPDGDLLIHSGDLTNGGTLAEAQRELDWLASLPHKHKVLIAGNHDSYFDPKSRLPPDYESGLKPNFHDLHYLENASLTLDFDGGRSLNIYASPYIPEIPGHPEFAFQYTAKEAPKFWANKIPMETDILITHTPPRHHLDIDLGCPWLLKELWRVKPRLHVFGHIHSGHGREKVFWDHAQEAYEQLMAAPRMGLIGDLLPSGAWIDVVLTVGYSIWDVLFGRLGTKDEGGLMINAAMVYGSTTTIGNPPEVVDL